jgi:hypothetical protein
MRPWPAGALATRRLRDDHLGETLDTLALKLVLTPALIGTASLVGRRWGPAVSGWLVGLPFTSGPVALFLALEHGPGFAAAVATGTILGTVAQAAFCLAYAMVTARRGWRPALAAGSVAFALTALALQRAALTSVPATALALCTLAAVLWLMPRAAAAPGRTVERPRWDLPARMVLATVLVLALTGLAPLLGPRVTGLLSTFPVYAGILAVFGHVLDGRPAALGVLRGLLMGLFAFAGFFFVVAALIERIGIAAAFTAALALALAVQAVSLRVIRKPA